jgi:hypothetical protein
MLSMIGILLLFLLLFFQMTLERRDPTMNRKAYTVCRDNLLYLGLAIESYRKDYQHIPDNLDQLAPRYLDTQERLHCPLDLPGQSREYQYFPKAQHPTDPLIVCKRHGYGPLILLRNGKLVLPNENNTRFAHPR